MKTVEVDHPLVRHKLGKLRDIGTDPVHFRQLAGEIAALLAYEATRALILQAIEIIFELNGWSEKYADQYDYIGFEDIQLVMQQESKSGIMPPSN